MHALRTQAALGDVARAAAERGVSSPATSSGAAGGSGDTNPMMSRSTPTPRNAITRGSPDSEPRSTRKSLATTTASRAAPSIQRMRNRREDATTIAATAVSVHASVSAACSGFDASMDESRHGTPPQ